MLGEKGIRVTYAQNSRLIPACSLRRLHRRFAGADSSNPGIGRIGSRRGRVCIRCGVRLRYCLLERSPGAIAVEIVRSLNAGLEPRTRVGQSDYRSHG